MSDYVVTVTHDKPSSGMWHVACGMWHFGPNQSWVTVKHIPTQISAPAYHRSIYKAREIALACVEMMVAECGETVCNFPEASK